MNKPAGVFISIEGGEGAGKSTQIALLKCAFADAKISALFTREPGGTASAEEIRTLLVTGEADRWHPMSETLLLMAARCEHVLRVIRPALEAGKMVVTDRFLDSTLVYQGIGKQLGSAWLMQLHRLVFGNVMPDLTLYLAIAPEAGLARTQARHGNETRFESMDMAFHHQVADGFLCLAKENPQRFVTIDASKTTSEVHRACLNAINSRFNIALAPQKQQVQA